MATDRAESTPTLEQDRVVFTAAVHGLGPDIRRPANEAKQLLRSGRRHRTVPLDSVAETSGPGDPHAPAELRDVLARMDPPDRELLAYRYVLGFTSDEIGSLLGITGDGVRSRLKRLRDRVRTEFTGHA